MGMAPMPMAPGTSGAAGGNDKNAGTKKLQPPTITNGRPVHGRFVADRLDAAPVVTRVRAKRPAVKLETESEAQAKK
jgi:hypothetical protein